MDSIQIKISEARKILQAIGIPLGEGELKTELRQNRLALTLLAVADIKPSTKWTDAKIHDDGNDYALRTRDIINFWNNFYKLDISLSSYDNVRRKNLVYLIEAGLVLRSANDPDANTNDPTRRYAISQAGVDILHRFGESGWEEYVNQFKDRYGDLRQKLQRNRPRTMIPVTLPSKQELFLTPGRHNVLQKAIVEEFLPRFAPSSEILYLGDTTRKRLFIRERLLQEMGFSNLDSSRLPDIIAYFAKQNWLLIIEAVHSSNPISQLRHLDLERLTAGCQAERIFVSVFQNREELRKWLVEISWETEVWLVDEPDHLIHFDGEKFLGSPEVDQRST